MATRAAHAVKGSAQNQPKLAQGQWKRLLMRRHSFLGLLSSLVTNVVSFLPSGKASGKRKLDFGSQRFRGKTFFLDLRGYRQAHYVETELLQRGAVS